MDAQLSRRRLLAWAPAMVTAAVAGCGRTTAVNRRADRLAARPDTPSEPEAGPVGLSPLGLDTGRDGQVYVPEDYNPATPLPLVVMLHGAGGNAAGGLDPFIRQAGEVGVILLAPESRQRTWDVLLGGYGADVVFIDRALRQTMSRYAVDPARVAVEGFSDGASYALGLGLANGDVFSWVVAFSPGFAPQSSRTGRPPIFISHGVRDDVLPIDRCSRRIVPDLRRRGYKVEYREFDDGHTIPEDIAADALRWLVG